MDRTAKDWAGTIVAFVLVIVVNGLADGLPLNGQGTGEITAQYPSLFTPAAFTFAIWGLIYSLLSAFVIYQALPGQRNNALLARISPWFKANCLSNAAWIFAWHYEYLWVSVLLTSCILGTAARIYTIVRAAGPARSPKEWVLTRLPFSLYTGWAVVALIANISCLQFAMGWNDALLVQADWTLLKFALAGTVGAVMALRLGDAAFAFVIAWAAFGVASKQVDTPEVAGAATLLALLVASLAVFQLVRSKTMTPSAGI